MKPMCMKITICASSYFFDKLPQIAATLSNEGHEVFWPRVEEGGGEAVMTKRKHDFIRDHFNNIDRSDAIYVANYDKKGISGYIGGNCLLEMGKAFDNGIPIFLMKNVKYSYRLTEENIEKDIEK